MFNILVKAHSFKTRIDVDSNDTIQQVKHKIQERHDIDVDKQDLYLGGKKLENKRTLRYYNIRQNDSIQLNQINIPGGIEIIVKNQKNNKPTILQVKSSYTIEEVKRKYEEEDGLSANCLKFIYNGKELENHRLLSDYCIKGKDIIWLVARVNGA
ncbi:polyubiquitin [Rhizophagus irregularis]|uniref:Polyubiquitin n=1 Tax=Rhizophagus irregularis TaxID=588596 RepID=A0A2I1EVT8_9GLOM|nr:polyubiquitin [Rhizophagus irregularis]PKC66562.1 polyubiquitin [Rhizophagus irregularis]PKY26241.1 polyubiquitin [Rhizophagus irregularis]CAB4495784.1 unnamed protein product [Rhizophagus irregularis]CAB5211559.1 unnamed protein product [Rhizophagus irregularis]